MKKYYLTLLIFCCFTLSINAQNWLTSNGGPSNDEALDVVSDTAGNYYVTGYFTNQVTFGATTLRSSGNSDIFIAKYDPLGIVQWAKKAGGNMADRAYSIKLDNSGHFYITGFYYGTANFGTSSISSVSNSQDVFVAKYDIAGNAIWVRSMGGTNAEIGNGVTTDNNDNVIVTGQFKGVSTFGAQTITSAPYMIDSTWTPGLPSFDIFTTKLDKNGNFLWTAQGKAKFDDRGIDVETDAANNIFVVGQYSDTLQLDNVHNNLARNAGFLLKYDSNGNEQWFTSMSAQQTLVNGIDIDQNDNIFITGDYIGTLQIFTTPTVINSSPYGYNIFIAKFTNTGDMLWVESDGSNSEVTSKSIVLDSIGDPYIAGLFKCRFDEYSEQWDDDGIFYSSGYRDVFISKYSATGTREWFKHFGSNEDDYCSGIALHIIDKPVIAGSFENQFNVPYSPTFTMVDSVAFNEARDTLYCSNSDYQKFAIAKTEGQKDIFITSPIDITTAQAPFDYFERIGATCTQNYLNPCIEGCIDTVHHCGPLSNLRPITQQITYPLFGPRYNYLWSTGNDKDTSGVINTSQTVWLKSERKDRCKVSYDTIQVVIHTIPPAPWITDSYSINVNRPPSTTDIEICGQDDITLWATNTTNVDTVKWSSDGTFTTINDSTIIINQTGTYHVKFSTSSFCKSDNAISIFMDDFALHDDLDPHIVFLDSILQATDTIRICAGDYIQAMVIDSAFYDINEDAIPYKTVLWNMAPPGSIQEVNEIGFVDSVLFKETYGFHLVRLNAPETGWYTLHDTLINACGDSTIYPLTRSYYVIVNPRPSLSFGISGPLHACPNDIITLNALGNGTNLIWQGRNILENHYDSIKVRVGSLYDDIYTLEATFVDTITGCRDSLKTSYVVRPRKAPRITMFPADGIICPNDSVLLVCDSGSSSYSWVGPGGVNLGSTQSIKTNTPGFYYCNVTSDDGCVQLSNFVEAKMYATPYLEAFPNSNICPDSSAVIVAQTSFLATIEWEAPLSGSGFTQTVSSPGTYYCKITQCDITTRAFVTITQTDVPAIITANSRTICPGDTLQLNSNLGMIEYNWVDQNKSDQFLYVTEPGTFILETTHPDGCIGRSDSYIVSTKPQIAVPTVNDIFLCKGENVEIKASAIDSIFWYYEATGGDPFFKGNQYAIPSVTKSVTFYIETYANPEDSNCESERIPVSVNVHSDGLSATTDIDSLPAGETTTIHAITSPDNTVYWLPIDEVSDPNAFNPTVSPMVHTTYTVAILDAEGCPVTKTVFIYVIPMNCGVDDIYIPNTFTPNDDNNNDILYVRGNEITELYFAVYNRWGERVFETEDINKGWDGIYKDMKSDPAVFHWYLRAKCFNGETIEKKGNVTLVR